MLKNLYSTAKRRRLLLLLRTLNPQINEDFSVGKIQSVQKIIQSCCQGKRNLQFNLFTNGNFLKHVARLLKLLKYFNKEKEVIIKSFQLCFCERDLKRKN